MLAIDARSGHVEWEYQLGGGRLSAPAVRDGVLYLTVGAVDDGEPSELVALGVGSGPDAGQPREVWRWQAPTTEPLYLAAVADDHVYVNGHETGVYAIDAGTGAGRLLLPTGGSVGPTSVVVGGDLYVGSADRTIMSVDRRSGEVHWSIEVPGEPTSPVVHEGHVVVGTDQGCLVAIAAQPSTE